jgi:hypothetical protein
MIAFAHDSTKLVSVWLHVGGPLTEGDIEQMIARMDQTAKFLERHKDAHAVTLVVVESDHLPDAKQRQQIGLASRRIGRGYLAVVNQSILARGVFTAIRWISANKEYLPHLFATYEEARAWVVASSGCPTATLDTLYAEARAKTRHAAGGDAPG